jgi:hypothetical protein
MLLILDIYLAKNVLTPLYYLKNSAKVMYFFEINKKN